MKQLLPVFVCLMFAAPASADDSFAYVGWLQSEHDDNSQLEAGVHFIVADNGFISSSLMLKDSGQQSWEGINLGFNVFAGNAVRLYAGAGLYGARLDNCDDNTQPECEAQYSGGVYPEAGVAFSIRRLYFGAYGRHYHPLDPEEQDHQVAGGFVGLRF